MLESIYNIRYFLYTNKYDKIVKYRFIIAFIGIFNFLSLKK